MYLKKISVLVLFGAVVIGAKECAAASSSGGKKRHPTFATSTNRVPSTKDIHKSYQRRHYAVSVRGGGGGGGDNDDGKASMLSSVFNLGT